MEYQTVVVGSGCGGAGAGTGGDGKDDRNKRPFPKEGGRQNNSKHTPNLTCPRCHSTNTKFCYYNNYSLSQPRQYCKDCQRNWTQGGTLRDVPVGGKRRQSKRSRVESVAVSASTSRQQQPLSIIPLSLVVPPTVVFRNNGNMRHFRRQNDVNSSSSLTPSTISSNTMPTNHVINFYPATAGPVFGDSLNVGNDVLPLLPPPPQPEIDEEDDDNNNNVDGEYNILEWVNNMGIGGFDEA